MGMGIAPAIGIGASLFGAHQQKKAIKRATEEQAAASRAAQERLAPYQEQGEYANEQIREGLDTGTLGGSFVPGDLASDPGYQFQLEQGEQALGRAQSARGNLYSGQAVKEASRFGQGLAKQSYQDAYNRWLQTQQNRYDQLSGQQRVGYGAASGGAGIDIGQGDNQASSILARREAQDRGTAGAIGSGLSYLDQFKDLPGIVGGGAAGGSVPSRFVGY